MGLLSDIFGFIDDLSDGGSYYKENSIEWCDKVWRRMLYTERGEARLYQVGDKIYRQLYVVLEDGIEGYPLKFLLVLKCSTKVSENLTWQNSGQYFVAQELKKKVKLKCCGI